MHRGRIDVKTEEDVVKLAPSILAADFARLGEQVAEAEKAGADGIHVDAMDGHFVPNLSMGAPVVASLRPVTRLPLETHLMISNPDFFLRVRRVIDQMKPECDLEVDGGIDPETARLCIEAGANVLVAGSAVFGSSESVMEAMSRLRAQK